MYPQRNDSFLYTCKENFFLGIHPLSVDVISLEGYQTLVEISKAFFREGRYELFLNYLQEGKYLCDVWAAHLILKFGNPDASVLAECEKVIGRAEL